jgi:hypothetical protein
MKIRLIKWLIRFLWTHHEAIVRVVVREFKHHVGKDPVRKKEGL